MKPANGYKVGDRVEIIEENTSGVITAINGSLLDVKTEDGFVLQYAITEVVPSIENPEYTFKGALEKQRIIQQESAQISKRKQTTKRAKVIPPMIVDLHIEKLTNDYKRMEVYEILELQLDRAKRSLDLAIQKKISRLVLIHGVGQGVLKAELEFLIGRYEGLNHEPADYRTFGQGATLVHISQKASRW